MDSTIFIGNVLDIFLEMKNIGFYLNLSNCIKAD